MNKWPQLIELSRRLPILTTVISAAFAWIILSRYRLKRQSHHLLWWGIGIGIYGVGTLLESVVTLFGWQVALFKAWYIAGALLGAAPLAIGTIYLLFGRRAGHVAVVLLGAAVSVTSIFVILSPVRMDLVDPKMLGGKVLAWQSIRRVSPFINSLAALFLIGGAIHSAIRFFRHPESRHVSIGNIFIAIGAILPGIGGMSSRMGHTELLYIGEFIGVILIWIGYKYCQRPLDAASLGAE
ncbi:MAG TPA: hypothetical protein VFY40_03695 [Blastocatellia bacterium]|nr:hypothetical protein [Blastocatellia bacterium]